MSTDPPPEQTLPSPPASLPPELAALGVTLLNGRWIVPLANKYKAQTIIRRLRAKAKMEALLAVSAWKYPKWEDADPARPPKKRV